MSLSNYKKALLKRSSLRSRRKISNLRKENDFMWTTLVELTRQHSRTTEKLLDLVDFLPRHDEHHHTMNGDEYGGHMVEVMPEEPCLCHEENVPKVAEPRTRRRASRYAEEIQNIKDEFKRWCCYVEDRTEKTQECSSEVQAANDIIADLQVQLQDALEKNQQWVSYDQQREQYVKEILAKVSWIENNLQDVCNARTSDRKDFLESEKRKVKQVERYYDGLLRKAHDDLEILREQVRITQQALTEAQRECRQKEKELEEVVPQFPSEDSSQTQEDEEFSTLEAEDLRARLKKERRKSATLQLQTGHLQKYFQNHYHKAEKQNATYKQAMEILCQDLQDEKQNCAYLKQQLEYYQKPAVKKESDNKTKDPAQTSGDPAVRPKIRLPPTRKSLMDESVMECPICRKPYRASAYNELIAHLDHCQN